jgi:hypothetical protein
MDNKYLLAAPFIHQRGIDWKAKSREGVDAQAVILTTFMETMENRLNFGARPAVFSTLELSNDKFIYHLCLNMLSELRSLDLTWLS